MQTQNFLSTAIMLLFVSALGAQNVGIGTETPTQLLSVAGSIAVDHDNTNTGTPGSASLLFGTSPSLVAISSNKSPGSSTSNGLEFWTNGTRRMMMMEEGTVGINIENPDPYYDFVVGGSTRMYSLSTNSASVSTNLYVNGSTNAGNNVNINGNAYNNTYRLTVNSGNSYFGGNGRFTGDLDVDNELQGDKVRANDYMSIGGALNPSYRLKVYGGNSHFGGDVEIVGTLEVDDFETNTINGTGVVRSQGQSSLRLGFNQVSFTLTLAAGSEVDVDVNISPFSGDADDVRVFVSQFEPDPLPQYANWHDFSFHVHSVDAGNDTCLVRITNTADSNRSIKGVLYLASVAKD